MPIKGRGVPVAHPKDTVPGFNSEFPHREFTGKEEELQGSIHGYKQKGVRRINLDLTSARNEEKIKVTGTAIWIADATSNTAIADIRLHTEKNDPIPFKSNTFIRGAPFQQLIVSNVAQPNDSLVIIIFTDSRSDNIHVEL